MPRLAAALLAAAAAALLVAGAAPAQAHAAEAEMECPGWEPDMDVVRGMLGTLMKALDAAKLPYWVNYGTLLGVIREGDIIDGDDDADLGMDHEHLETLLDGEASDAIQAALNKQGYQLVRSNNNDLKVYPLRCAKKGTEKAYFKNCCENVDIFFYAKEGKCMMRRCFDAAEWGMACSEDIVKDSFPASLVSKIIPYGGVKTKASFGRRMPVPLHYNKYLRHVYGRGWRHPGKNKYPQGGRSGCTP